MAAERRVAMHWVKTMHALRRSPSAQHFRRHEHSRRVAELAEAVALLLELPHSEVTRIRRAALLHDVGNAGIPEEILLKPGPLTESEFCYIKEHVHRGTRDFGAVKALRDAVPIVRHHHERVDGNGYPAGLAGDAIPIGARVIAAADAYVMMTADVPWRAAKSHDEAIDELRASAGTHLDEDVVNRLVGILRERHQGNGAQ